MKVNEIMNRSVITCAPHETLSTILNKFKLFNISGMPVAEMPPESLDFIRRVLRQRPPEVS